MITFWAKCMHERCTRVKSKWTTISEITTLRKEQYMSQKLAPWTRDKKERPMQTATQTLIIQ
jgi:hypothetical protein